MHLSACGIVKISYRKISGGCLSKLKAGGAKKPYRQEGGIMCKVKEYKTCILNEL